MAINKRAKGLKIQRKAIEDLGNDGWFVNKVEVGGMYEKSKDLFGLFDLLCINRHEVLFVQVTCNKPHSHGKYAKFSEDYQGISCKYQQWVHYDRKGWVKFVYYKGRQLKYDERKGKSISWKGREMMYEKY